MISVIFSRMFKKSNYKKSLYGFGSAITDLGGKGVLGNLNSLEAIANFALTLTFRIGLVLTVIFTIFAGIKFITSKGDPGKFNEARDALVNVIIGFVLLVSFIAIVNLALRMIGVNTSIIEILKGN